MAQHKMKEANPGKMPANMSNHKSVPMVKAKTTRAKVIKSKATAKKG